MTTKLTKVIKVLLVDDQELMRAGLRQILESIKFINVTAEAASGEEAIKLSKQVFPDVIILDIKLPGISGLETANKIIKADPSAKILIMTGVNDDVYPSRLLEIGVCGYLTKDSSKDEIVTAVRQVSLGQRYVSHHIAQKLLFEKSGLHSAEGVLDRLSNKELQVALLIGNGKKTKEIAEQMHLSPKTINSYRYRIFQKLKIKSNIELMHILIQHSVLKPNEGK